MRGNVNYQVQQLFNEVKAFGESRHEAKEAARATGARTSAEIAAKVGVHSYATADQYRDVWRDLGNHMRDLGERDMEKITNEHIASFLNDKIESGIAASTLSQYSAAIAKLEVALNSYNEHSLKMPETVYSFRDTLNEIKENSGLQARSDYSRAYHDPYGLVSSISNQAHQLAASIQLESGARIHEVQHISSSQLQGYAVDPVSGQEKGVIETLGKGGKGRELYVSKETYDKLAEKVEQGRLTFNFDSYRESIAQASLDTNQNYNGSHGLRWNFAQARVVEVQNSGKSYDQALVQVSQEMGHERGDITEHYLK